VLTKAFSFLPGGKAAVRLVAGTASLFAGGWVLRTVQDTPAALGASATAIRKAAVGSPNYRNGVFHNLEPSSAIRIDAEENRLVLFEMFSRKSESRPKHPIPLADVRPPSAAAALAVTWLGHATALVEIDGYRVLTDPVWSERVSPLNTVGPARLHPPPLDLEALPALDVVVISHDHYDHLDMDTVQLLARTQRAMFVTALGVGAHLRAWGVPAKRIVELDWNSSYTLDDLTLTCLPARHFSGRFLSRNSTLWSSWAFTGPQHRVYFGGDSGYTRSFADIGAAHGPFDVTLLPIGAYNKSWPDIHMNPEEAVRAHLDLNASASGRDLNASASGGVLVPIHWGTFRLAPHPWAEPADRLVEAALADAVDIAVPKPGGRVAPAVDGTPPVQRWWRR
jgi:L-ascorbate metabolism protein UlaG (beta-lactamase superfamily)